MKSIISIYSPPEDKADISRDTQISLTLQKLEEDEVQNMEEKEQMITRNGKLATIMQQKEEGEAQKLMEKEQQAMTSTPSGMPLLLVQRVISLRHFIQSSVTQNLGIASKVTTLAMDSIFFFADCLLHLQVVFIVAVKNATAAVGCCYI